MFDRATYKKNALRQLKNRWTIPAIVSLITISILAVLGIQERLYTELQMELPWHISLLIISIVGVLAIALIKLCVTMSYNPEKPTFNDYLEGFYLWFKGIRALLWCLLWTSLWSMLFFIPGVVKFISYSQLFFVIAEYPSIGVCKAMRISKILTQGHKADLFVMELSFFGWIFLASLTCGIGYIWLTPYKLMAFTNAYKALKEEALATKKLSIQDFIG